ncbi:MAG: tryptophan synthase subunit alpha [Nitrospirae bacterium]|nr:tryptophan synthase subunit alpha [Nitrospirota bacterium]
MKTRAGGEENSSQKKVIPYLMAGDRDLGVTEKLLRAAKKEGVWAVELGVPFSDPTADGPVIQEAAQRSIGPSTSLRRLLSWLGTIPVNERPPVYLMTYFNLFLAMGLEKFVAAARQAGGIRGAVIPDLSYEDAEPVRKVFHPAGLSLIPFVSLTTSEERMKKIVASSEDFIYLVSLLGTTGKELSETGTLSLMVDRIRTRTESPVCVGFGIQSPAVAGSVLKFADGVIVGSRLVREETDPEGWQKLLSTFCNVARSVAGPIGVTP